MKIIRIIIGFLSYCWISIFSMEAQPVPTVMSYPFLCNECNAFSFTGNSPVSYKYLYQKFSNLIFKGEGTIHILQIGDSHIQSDHFSGQMRRRIRQFMPGIAGSRGFVFPYRTAKTNNPDNYRVESEGNWISCRNVQNVQCDMGLSGITITTNDSSAKIRIRLKNNMSDFFDFNTVKVFHNFGDSTFLPEIQPSHIVKKVIYHSRDGYTEFHLNEFSEDITIGFVVSKVGQRTISIYGLSLENEDPGVIYSSLGVNGAEVSSFLKCNLLQQQLKVLNPDWVILSLGTNDAFGKGFVPDDFKNKYRILIDRFREVLPDVPILLTTPADCYRKGINNPNMALAGTVIKELAEEKNCAVWDLYQIMGGKGSMMKWLRAGLGAHDRVHFSVLGYYLQGDLLFDAFFNSYDRFLDNKL